MTGLDPTQWLGPAVIAYIEQRIEQATAPLQTKITQLESLLDEEVDTKTALRITGIKSDSTLRIKRDEKGTLIKYTGIGRSIRYSRASLSAFVEARRLRKQQPCVFNRRSAA